MSATLTYVGELTITSCWCGIRLAIPNSLYRQARDNGTTVYCPIGHIFAWKETEVDRLRAQADQAKRDAKFWRDQADNERRRHASTKGQLTKTKNRVANGVCPCCNRSFEQLARHMKSQHPNYPNEATP